MTDSKPPTVGETAVILDSRDLLGAVRVGRFLRKYVGTVDPYTLKPKNARELKRKLRLCRKAAGGFRPEWICVGRRAMPVAAVTVEGVVRLISDLLMRMLKARELFRCQGFPDSYILTGTSSRSQIARCGNSVPPRLAAAVIGANPPAREMVHGGVA